MTAPQIPGRPVEPSLVLIDGVDVTGLVQTVTFSGTLTETTVAITWRAGATVPFHADGQTRQLRVRLGDGVGAVWYECGIRFGPPATLNGHGKGLILP